VSIKQLRNTMAQILELSGLKDASRYFSEITPEAEAQLAAPQGQQQADPAQLLAQVEMRKLDLQEKKQQAEDDLKRDQLDADIWLKATEINAKYGTQMQVEQLYAMIQRERDAAKIMAQQQQAAMRAQQQPMGVQ
jgi:hypothetical protein